MKRSDLKELIREEIKKVLSENTNLSSKYPAGTYEIKYKIVNRAGDDEGEADDNITIDAEETYKDVFGNDYSERNFWVDKIRKKYGYLKFPIDRILSVTKIG